MFDRRRRIAGLPIRAEDAREGLFHPRQEASSFALAVAGALRAPPRHVRAARSRAPRHGPRGPGGRGRPRALPPPAPPATAHAAPAGAAAQLRTAAPNLVASSVDAAPSLTSRACFDQEV